MEESWNACSDSNAPVAPLVHVEQGRVEDYKTPGTLNKNVHQVGTNITVLPAVELATFKLEEALVTPLTKMSGKLWQQVIIQGCLCKVQDTKTSAKNHQYKHVCVVDQTGNYVPCLAFGAQATKNVQEMYNTPNITVLLCFVQAKPPKPNPQYPNENGKVWFYDNSFIFAASTHSTQAEPKQEIVLK